MWVSVSGSQRTGNNVYFRNKRHHHRRCLRSLSVVVFRVSNFVCKKTNEKTTRPPTSFKSDRAWKTHNLKATIEHIDGSSARYAVNIFSPEPDFSQANRGHRSATTEKALVNLTARLITTRNTEESRENPLLALGILFATWIRFLHV